MNTTNQTASGNGTSMPEPYTYISQARLEQLISQDPEFMGKISRLLLSTESKGDELAECSETLENFFHAYIAGEEWQFECENKGWIIMQYKAIRYLLGELDNIFKEYCLGGHRNLLITKTNLMKETNNTLVNEVLSIRETPLECLFGLASYKNYIPEMGLYLKSLKEAVFAGKVHGLPEGDIITFLSILTGILDQLQAFYSKNPNLDYSQLKLML